MEIHNSTGETREARISEADRLSKEYRKFFVMTAAILADIERNDGLSPEVKKALQKHGYDGDFMADQIGDLYGLEKLPDSRQDSPILIDYKSEYQTTNADGRWETRNTDKLEVPTTADLMVMVLSSFHLAALYNGGINFNRSISQYESGNTQYGKSVEWGNHLDSYDDRRQQAHRSELNIWDVFNRWDQGYGFSELEDPSYISTLVSKNAFATINSGSQPTFIPSWVENSKVMPISDLVWKKYSEREDFDPHDLTLPNQEMYRLAGDNLAIGQAVWNLAQSMSDEEMSQYKLVFRTYGTESEVKSDVYYHCSELDITNSVLPSFIPEETPSPDPSPSESPTSTPSPSDSPTPSSEPIPSKTPTPSTEPETSDDPTSSSSETTPSTPKDEPITSTIPEHSNTPEPPMIPTPDAHTTENTTADTPHTTEPAAKVIPSSSAPVVTPPAVNHTLPTKQPVPKNPSRLNTPPFVPAPVQPAAIQGPVSEHGPVVNTGGAVHESFWTKIANIFH